MHIGQIDIVTAVTKARAFTERRYQARASRRRGRSTGAWIAFASRVEKDSRARLTEFTLGADAPDTVMVFTVRDLP